MWYYAEKARLQCLNHLSAVSFGLILPSLSGEKVAPWHTQHRWNGPRYKLRLQCYIFQLHSTLSQKLSPSKQNLLYLSQHYLTLIQWELHSLECLENVFKKNLMQVMNFHLRSITSSRGINIPPTSGTFKRASIVEFVLNWYIPFVLSSSIEQPEDTQSVSVEWYL